MVLFLLPVTTLGILRIGQLEQLELTMIDPVRNPCSTRPLSPPQTARPALWRCSMAEGGRRTPHRRMAGGRCQQSVDSAVHTGATRGSCPAGPPSPEAEMMSTGWGHARQEQAAVRAWEDQAQGPWWPGGGHLRVLGP